MWSQFWTFVFSEEPSGPSTPFAAPVVVFDILRVIVISSIICLIALTPRAMRRCTVLGQKARLLGATVVFGGVFVTELEHFGDFVNYRLYVFFFASAMMAWGYWSLFHYEDPAAFRIEREE